MTGIGHFIGNAHVAGVSGRRQPVYNPATGAAGKTVALASAAAFHDLGIHFATITVNGAIKSGTPYAPEAIAERFWQAHIAPRPDWTGAILFDGA